MNKKGKAESADRMKTSVGVISDRRIPIRVKIKVYNMAVGTAVMYGWS